MASPNPPSHGGRSTSEQPETKSKTYKIHVNQGTKYETSFEVHVGSPLTPEELQIAASKKDHDHLFVMEFPNQSNSYCYLDTYQKYKRYQALPEKKDLSLLMRIRFSDEPPGYRLSTLVTPAAYLSLTGTYIAGYQKLKYMNFLQGPSIPIFQVLAQGDYYTDTLLSFSTRDESGKPWYLYPYDSRQGPMVVSTSHISFNYNVCQVTSKLPEAIVSWMKKK